MNSEERMIFRISVERLLSQYSKEDQENINNELQEIMKISNSESLGFDVISCIIYYYFKFKELEKLKKD